MATKGYYWRSDCRLKNFAALLDDCMLTRDYQHCLFPLPSMYPEISRPQAFHVNMYTVLRLTCEVWAVHEVADHSTATSRAGHCQKWPVASRSAQASVIDHDIYTNMQICKTQSPNLVELKPQDPIKWLSARSGDAALLIDIPKSRVSNAYNVFVCRHCKYIPYIRLSQLNDVAKGSVIVLVSERIAKFALITTYRYVSLS